MIVLDTSALVAFLVGADPIAEMVRDATAGSQLSAPHAIDLECAGALRGLVRGGKLSAEDAERALQLLLVMKIRRHDHRPLLRRIWQLRDNMGPYDAAYVALAETLGAPLITVDGNFAGAPGITCVIRDLRAEA